MKTILVLIACITFGILNAAAGPTEDSGNIYGRVTDKVLNEPLPYVTVVVKKLNGEIITGAVTDDAGKFEIHKIPEGRCNISIQYIGYKVFTTEINITKGNATIDLGNILLEEDIASLDEVNIVAERSTIEQRLDKKVINIGKDLSTAGPTASDIMNNLPTVSIDPQSGELSMRGNENVRVMVDGKLSNIPVAQLLKQIPSSSIKQIELITNPSAKYNPEGMSGLINIILHKNVNVGFNGNASVGLTFRENAKFNAGLDMNYRNGKFNFYTNLGNNVSKHENNGLITRSLNNSREVIHFLDDSKSNLFKVGLDFYLNEKNTLSFFTNQNIYDGKGNGSSTIFYLDQPSLNQEQLFFYGNENIASQYNFDYKVSFDETEHTLELEADYNVFSNETDGKYVFNGASPLENFKDSDETDRSQLTVNLDYVNPLSESLKIEAGAEARLFETKIDFASNGQSYNANGELVPTPSTHFEYVRDIYSFYTTVGKTFEKWSYQLGARIENVSVQADTNNVQAFTNDYFQIYPSAFVTYSPSEKNQYQLSYSRRVDRPGLDQVNPIREFSTPLISSYGNINLEPQFTNSIEANYTRNLDAGSITAGIFYRIVDNEINRAILVDRTNLDRSILTFQNFESTDSYGLEISGNYKPTKWWSVNSSFELYKKTQKGITEIFENPTGTPAVEDIVTQVAEVDNVSWNVRMMNNFTVTKNLTFSAFGLYRAKNKGIQFESEPRYFVNLGARYSLWEGRGTFSVNYNDVFDSMKFAFSGDTPYPQSGEFKNESNTIYVGLTYRFGGGNYRAKSRKSRDDNTSSGGGGLF
ncbi:TonB-dependent receptor domain-containing protein [Aequorivita vladivostokensis]|uniref:TonB-dependent receptor n=1 Tax=Aequorivita vladivostokensis TaxID=171194 RepID=A0ABR5DEZ8_9FLAO|nr:outer membrane beta-barrel family protein [Aequorivita vladivostokensis]KJJ37342.1 TonB-dependent receptor [Aequorivita vladivostokensis]